MLEFIRENIILFIPLFLILALVLGKLLLEVPFLKKYTNEIKVIMINIDTKYAHMINSDKMVEALSVFKLTHKWLAIIPDSLLKYLFEKIFKLYKDEIEEWKQELEEVE